MLSLFLIMGFGFTCSIAVFCFESFLGCFSSVKPLVMKSVEQEQDDSDGSWIWHQLRQQLWDAPGRTLAKNEAKSRGETIRELEKLLRWLKEEERRKNEYTGWIPTITRARNQ